MELTALSRPRPKIAVFAPPYEEFVDVDLSWTPPEVPPRGLALVWWLVDGRRQENEFHWLRERPHGLPLVVVLPPARAVARTAPLLNHITTLDPRTVLPTGRIASPLRLRALMATPPRQFPSAITRYLIQRRLLHGERIRREVRQIFEAAPDVTSISKLARRLYTSRRTLGRHFAAAGLPVPSHWLQFGRLIHVAVRLQSDSSAMFRIASRARYPDSFTMSNQMKRLIGYRPSDVRRLLGWEWVIESWLRQEVRNGAVDPKRHRAALRSYFDARGNGSDPTRAPSGDATTD